MKIVLNEIRGGLGFSKATCEFLGIPLEGNECLERYYETHRDDPELVKCVETLGDETMTLFTKLKVVEIPVGVNWHIEATEYGEQIVEAYRTWF